MKIGIIIIFCNNAEDIDSNYIISSFREAEKLEICLVNNDSRDNTYEILKEIKEECKNVSLVNIKKFKSDISAVRAGARYLFNRFDLSHIGYVSTCELNNKFLNGNNVIKVICENLDDIKKYNITILNKQVIKPTLFQSIFSVTKYLKEIKVEHQLARLH